MLTKRDLDELEQVLQNAEGTTRIQWPPEKAGELLSLTKGLIEAIFYFAKHDSDLMVEAMVTHLVAAGYGKRPYRKPEVTTIGGAEELSQKALLRLPTQSELFEKGNLHGDEVVK